MLELHILLTGAIAGQAGWNALVDRLGLYWSLLFVVSLASTGEWFGEQAT